MLCVNKKRSSFLCVCIEIKHLEATSDRWGHNSCSIPDHSVPISISLPFPLRAYIHSYSPTSWSMEIGGICRAIRPGCRVDIASHSEIVDLGHN